MLLFLTCESLDFPEILLNRKKKVIYPKKSTTQIKDKQRTQTQTTNTNKKNEKENGGFRVAILHSHPLSFIIIIFFVVIFIISISNHHTPTTHHRATQNSPTKPKALLPQKARQRRLLPRPPRPYPSLDRKDSNTRPEELLSGRPGRPFLRPSERAGALLLLLLLLSYGAQPVQGDPHYHPPPARALPLPGLPVPRRPRHHPQQPCAQKQRQPKQKHFADTPPAAGAADPFCEEVGVALRAAQLQPRRGYIGQHRL